MIVRYLSLSRSRSAQKGFFDWGNESIITPSFMKPLVYDELTCTSYLEYRLHKKQCSSFDMTCSYSICTRVFNDVIPALPSTCQPLRMLDIGCGCGSASLFTLLFRFIARAALEHFPSINHVSLVDGSEYMTDMASSLLSLRSSASIACYSSFPSLLDSVTRSQSDDGFDVILMDRFLSELPSDKARASAVVIAWGRSLLLY